jgi:DNA-binding IclR family transcriptional regulator
MVFLLCRNEVSDHFSSDPRSVKLMSVKPVTTRPNSKSPPNDIQSVSAALRLLETIAQHAGRGMSELAAQTDMTHNQVHRLLATLERHGYVTRGADRGYQLGPKLALLGRGANRYHALIEAAREPMNELSALSGESILLAVRSGLERLVIDRRISTHSLRVDWEIGSRLPLHVGGLGVALLAFAPARIQAEVLKAPIQAFTPKTLVKPDALRLELERVRRSRVRVSVDDYAIGEFSVAAPVLNAQGEAIAAVNIAGFTARLSSRTSTQYTRAIREASAQIAANLEN